ncbi:S41 family peptidase [Actinacidiphila rubida]|uniref:hypothetical protein n=1 Tax=Actinacidiphila rubida TaxID=310780 RepID=UPI000849D0A5|nr:hypothetical protein [Actinacidiphila rubida]
MSEASGGRLGYPRIPDVMARGWAELRRDLDTEFARDGLIVDLRDAGGGDASHLVAGKVARRPRLGRVPLRPAGQLPARGTARARRGDHRRIRLLGR